MLILFFVFFAMKVEGQEGQLPLLSITEVSDVGNRLQNSFMLDRQSREIRIYKIWYSDTTLSKVFVLFTDSTIRHYNKKEGVIEYLVRDGLIRSRKSLDEGEMYTYHYDASKHLTRITHSGQSYTYLVWQDNDILQDTSWPISPREDKGANGISFWKDYLNHTQYKAIDKMSFLHNVTLESTYNMAFLYCGLFGELPISPDEYAVTTWSSFSPPRIEFITNKYSDDGLLQSSSIRKYRSEAIDTILYEWNIENLDLLKCYFQKR